MSNKSQKSLSVLYDVLRTLLSYGITVYIFLLIVVLPLYFEQGYGYIATDKAYFFCKVGINMGKVLLPVLIVYAITAIAVNHAKMRCFLKKKDLKVVAKQLICKISALDFFVGMYGVAVILSYLCSDYREDALWGMPGWYMGFVPQMILVAGYFLVGKLWQPNKWMFYLILPVATVVFVLGYLNRFGYYPIEMEYANYSYISTIGNINWYCSYVVPVLFAGIGLFLGTTARSKHSVVLRAIAYACLCMFIFLGFATLITQGSASGIFALGVTMLVLFCVSVKEEGWLRRFWITALLLSMACVGTMFVRNYFPEAITYSDEWMDFLSTGWLPILMTLVSFIGLACSFLLFKNHKVQGVKVWHTIAILCVTLVSCVLVVYIVLLTVNTINPGALGKFSENPVFVFSDKWGSNRGATWKIGVLCFGEQDFLHKLVGVGPDAMWSYIDTDCSDVLAELMQKNFGTSQRLTNAHNEWLTILVNYGIFGLVSFVGIIASAIWLFLGRVIGKCQSCNPVKSGRKKNDAETLQVIVACGLGILAHTINNIFSFQQVVNVTLLFLLLGIGRAFLRASEGPNA